MGEDIPSTKDYKNALKDYNWEDKKTKIALEKKRKRIVGMTRSIFMAVEKDIKRKLGPDYIIEKWVVGNSVWGELAMDVISFDEVKRRKDDGSYERIGIGQMTRKEFLRMLGRISEERRFLLEYGIDVAVPKYFFPPLGGRY